MRYKRHDTPLWPTSTGRVLDVPDCASCGKPRTFEFQLLPTLLYMIGAGKAIDEMDWATIVVYTCASDCEVEHYAEEFCWVQIFENK